MPYICLDVYIVFFLVLYILHFTIYNFVVHMTINISHLNLSFKLKAQSWSGPTPVYIQVRFDGLCTLLNAIIAHLGRDKTFVRLIFIDFSSAFNCIQPHVLEERLKNVHNIDPGMVLMLLSPPQGGVFTSLICLYTNMCQRTKDVLLSHLLMIQS